MLIQLCIGLKGVWTYEFAWAKLQFRTSDADPCCVVLSFIVQWPACSTQPQSSTNNHLGGVTEYSQWR